MKINDSTKIKLLSLLCLTLLSLLLFIALDCLFVLQMSLYIL